MSIRLLLKAFERMRLRGEPMVLASVVQTIGSTYSKPGALMLVAADGETHGLLSGGCLEGDLVEHARAVLDAGEPRQVSYDTRNRSEDELWGLGLGCDGFIRIFLQPLLATDDHAPLGGIARCAAAHVRGGYAVLLHSASRELAPGSALVVGEDGDDAAGPGPRRALADAARAARDTGNATLGQFDVDGKPATVFAAPVPLPPRLLVLGAGPDAAPLVRLARELGWHITVADHRPAHVRRIGDSRPDAALAVKPARPGDSLPLASFDAAVVMSHHLGSDRLYLQALARTPVVRYVGLLGPPARRARLLEDADLAAALEGRLYGPAGLDIGARTPQGIALAILAEAHAVLAGHGGGHLLARSPGTPAVERVGASRVAG